MPTALTKATTVSPAVSAMAATARGMAMSLAVFPEAAPCSRLWNSSHSPMKPLRVAGRRWPRRP